MSADLGLLVHVGRPTLATWGSSPTETTNGNGDRRNEQATVFRFFFERKVVLGVIVVMLTTGALWATSRAATSVVVPNLLGD